MKSIAVAKSTNTGLVALYSVAATRAISPFRTQEVSDLFSQEPGWGEIRRVGADYNSCPGAKHQPLTPGVSGIES